MLNKRYFLLNTMFEGNNYGSSLQAFALKTYIEKNFNSNCFIVKIKYKGFSRIINSANRKFTTFLNMIRSKDLRTRIISNKHNIILDYDLETKQNFLKFSADFLKPIELTKKQFETMSQSYDCCGCITGSDQIWNPSVAVVNRNNYLYYSKNKVNISYAASFGQNYINKYNMSTIDKYLNKLTSISVRETTGKQILETHFNLSSEVVLDPTLLLGGDFWKNIAFDRTEDNFVLCYFLNEPSDAAVNLIKKLFNEKQKIFCISRIENIKNVVYLNNLSPFDFVGVFKKCNMVLTDSYHGVIFSILLEKDFYVFKRDYLNQIEQNSRITDFLSDIGLLKRYIADVYFEQDKINYTNVNDVINMKRFSSEEFLKKSLYGK